MSTTDRLVPPLEHPFPPDEARRLQPDTELFRVPVALLQVWIHLRRRAQRGIDGRVAPQRGPEFCELPAELVQRVAAPVLDAFVLRVPPQGSQHRVRHGLRRQTRQVAVRALQVVQRVRGFARSPPVFASGAFGQVDFIFSRRPN